MTEINNKKWFLGMISFLILYIFLNFYYWFNNTHKLFRPYPICGDLARIELDLSIAECKREVRNLSKLLKQPDVKVILNEGFVNPVTYFVLGRHHKFNAEITGQAVMIKEALSDNIPILTIGDSISRGRGGGINNYWQDYLATHTQKNVGWVPEISDHDYLRTAIILLNSGFLEKYNTEHLIIQTAERHAIKRLARDVDFNETMNLNKVAKLVRKNEGTLFTDPRHYIHASVNDMAMEDTSLYLNGMLSKFIFMHSSNVIKSFDNFFGNYIHPHLYTSEDYRLNRIPPFSDKPLTRILASIFYNSNDSTRAMDWESKMTFNVGTDIFTMSAVLNNHYKMLKYELLSSIGFLNGSRNNTKVEKLELKKKLFSHNKGNNLYFLKGDLKSNGKFRPEKLDRMHNNLNLLSDLLNKKNITLHFLPSPNKLTAYQSQLVKPLEGRNKSVFFEKLKSLPNKRYNYVDSLEIIDTFIKNGTMDVYHFDDSHWNYIPLQSIINDIKIN